MLHLAPADYKRTAWKNGGGTTTELAISPKNATLSDFLWRVSIAEVDADGPFSLFPGCERAIMLIEGAGMTLDAGEYGSSPLLEPFQTWSFSGDWPIFGRLVSGPVRDFNLILRRDAVRGSLNAAVFHPRYHVKCPPGATLICHILKENADSALQGDTLITDRDLTLAAAGDQPVTAILATIRKNVQFHKA
jgi:uncharacterized protein